MTSPNNLNNYQSFTVIGGRFQITNTFKLPVSLKALNLQNVQVNSIEYLVETGISGSNLEHLTLLSIFDQAGNKITFTIDLSKFKLPKIKTMDISAVNFVSSSRANTEFKKLKSLTFVHLQIKGPISTFKIATNGKFFCI